MLARRALTNNPGAGYLTNAFVVLGKILYHGLFGHQKSVHTEGQRQTQAAGHLDRAGSGLHDSSKALLSIILC